MAKAKLSDEERLRKKEAELERARKELELRTNIRKAKAYAKEYSDKLKEMKTKRGAKK